jgi:hypothetical protein
MTGTAWFDDAFIIPILNDKINILMLRPVYRGLLFNDGNQQIILSAELNPAAINKDDSYISTVIYNSSGNKLITDSIDITGGKEYHTISINAANLQEGNYLLNASLIDKNGASVYSWSSKIKKIERANQPAVCFDDHKRLLVNGKKVFPLGMYWGSIDEADLNIYAESKFNFLLAYSRPTGEQMNMAEKSNMKVVYSVKDYYAGSPYAPAEIKSSGDETILLKKTLEEFKDSPSLLAWYINDEYSPDYINRLNEHYTLITDEDPNHPVLSIILHPFQTNLYLHSTDVIGNDPYVVPNSPLYKVGEATKTVVNQTNDSRPVWMVIQAHNIGNYKEFIPNPQDYRTPTYDEMRSMSWQAICNGADGLIYYSYFDLKRNPDVPFEIQWSNLKRIVTEIDTFSNALLSDNKADSIRINSGDGDNTWFNWTTRNFNNRLYIFVVANGKNEGKIEFNIPGKYKSIRRINENPQELKLINSKFSDTIKNMDVRIYSAD